MTEGNVGNAISNPTLPYLTPCRSPGLNHFKAMSTQLLIDRLKPAARSDILQCLYIAWHLSCYVRASCQSNHSPSVVPFRKQLIQSNMWLVKPFSLCIYLLYTEIIMDRIRFYADDTVTYCSNHSCSGLQVMSLQSVLEK